LISDSCSEREEGGVKDRGRLLFLLRGVQRTGGEKRKRKGSPFCWVRGQGSNRVKGGKKRRGEREGETSSRISSPISFGDAHEWEKGNGGKGGEGKPPFHHVLA